jgi:CHAT domain-containing protein/lipopolysaccharide biosynthesis regulator YciM
MKRLVIIILLLLGNTTIFAQENTISNIQKAITEANYELAIELIHDSNTSNNEENIIIKNLQVEVLIRQGKLEEATTILQQTKELVSLLNNADKYEGITYTNLGFLQLNLGRYDLATENLQIAIDLFERSGAGSSAEAARALSFLGLVYSTSGKHNQALDHQLRAIAIRKNIFGEIHVDVAASYNDLGFAFSLVNADQALNNYEQALSIYTQLYTSDNPRIAQSKINIGFIYSQLEFYGDAILNFEEALNIWKKVYEDHHPNKALVLAYLARTYNQMQDTKTALAYYEQALNNYKGSYGNKHPDIAQTYNRMAIIKLGDNNWEEALAFLQSAIIANVPNFENNDININPPVELFYNGTVLLDSYLYKARAFETRHYNKTLLFKDLEKALGALQSCDTLIEKLRRQSSNESDKFAVGAIATEVYEDGVRLSKAMSEITWRSKKYRELSFYFAEKSKSAVLLDAISESEAKSFANIPEELIEEEKSLKATIAFCAQRLAEKPEEAEERALREAYFDLSRDYELFVKKLENEFPEYFNLKFNSVAPSISLIQEKLKPNEALLSYFIAEKEQRLYIYSVTKKRFNIESKKIDRDFERYLIGFRNSIYFQDKETYLLTAHNIYKLIMPRKIPTGISNLVIIPAGRMGTIPFEALLSSKVDNKEINFSDFPYLLNRYSITYEFTSGLILQENKSTTANSSNILLCAPVNFSANRLLPELPGTEREVNRIAEIFTSKNYDSKILIFEAASEDALKSKDLKAYGVLHLATHGIVDEVNPELSRIFLNKETSSGEDGSLFSGEIYNLELDADLVVLSACQTGLGKVSKGEGVIGLSRALVYAGARKLIVSYWSVSDESTAELMMRFYEHLLAGNKLNESAKPLRHAKIDLTQSEVFADPFYWAPFILIGY